MAGVPPNSLRPDELPEYSFVGPFGGIQSEVSLDKIGRSGFAEVQNVLFRKSQARFVPAFVSLISPDNSVIIGIGDFFSVDGVRHFIVWTAAGKMWTWAGGGWTQVAGNLTPAVNQFMSWDVIGYKIYFSQQIDPVWVWDGITAGFAVAGAGAPIGKYLCELAFHLLVANTVEAGPTKAPNRIHWSGADDGTDWTSFDSGQADIFNGLGPINGLSRIYQSGYAFQQWGITQIVPTGIGTAPFQFISMGSRAKGSILPYGVATFGEIISAYVGKNDIYIFDGNESIGIGSKPIDGNRRLGARGRIFSDLFNATQSNITSIISSSFNGVDYESYWLLIPSLNKAWVYHFDEQNWTQVFFNTDQLWGPAGIFSTQSVPRIEDLIGTIISQSWSPSTLTGSAPLDTMAISDVNANSVSLLNFGIPSSLPTSGSLTVSDGWYIKSGQLTFDDPRHGHTVKKIRLVLIDYTSVTINLRLTNEFGQTSGVKTLSYGTGSGLTITKVIEFSLAGKYITWEMSGPKGINWGMSEITLIFDTAGEIQGGSR